MGITGLSELLDGKKQELFEKKRIVSRKQCDLNKMYGFGEKWAIFGRSAMAGRVGPRTRDPANESALCFT
jgi:hypothetical protein